jgi:hypothetical protein
MGVAEETVAESTMSDLSSAGNDGVLRLDQRLCCTIMWICPNWGFADRSNC